MTQCGQPVSDAAAHLPGAVGQHGGLLSGVSVHDGHDPVKESKACRACVVPRYCARQPIVVHSIAVAASVSPPYRYGTLRIPILNCTAVTSSPQRACA